MQVDGTPDTVAMNDPIRFRLGRPSMCKWQQVQHMIPLKPAMFKSPTYLPIAKQREESSPGRSYSGQLLHHDGRL
jgi:hypothetical protein